MFDFDYLRQVLIISMTLSTITCTLIQKTKGIFKKSKWIIIYSLLINMVIGMLFCITFTEISLPNSMWIGFFSFLGADSIYKSLEGKISSYSDIIRKKNLNIKQENIINKEDE